MKPYANDLPVDWMNLTPSDWMDRYVPGWRQSSYGNLLEAKPADWLGWIYPQYAGGAGGMARRQSPEILPRDRTHTRGCRCRDCVERECRRCDPDPCECYCCIGDVDLVLYARVGEQRVIPIEVENPRRREKSVTVELSGWRTRGGGAAPVDTISVELPGAGAGLFGTVRGSNDAVFLPARRNGRRLFEGNRRGGDARCASAAAASGTRSIGRQRVVSATDGLQPQLERAHGVVVQVVPRSSRCRAGRLG